MVIDECHRGSASEASDAHRWNCVASADTRTLAESAPGCSLQIGAELEKNRDTMMSSDPRLRADLKRTAFVVSAMINMLIAILGAQRVARSAVGECILMFRTKYFRFLTATILNPKTCNHFIKYKNYIVIFILYTLSILYFTLNI